VNVPNGALPRLEIGKRAPRLRQEGLSSIGGAHDAARAVEQLPAQLLLDLSNLLRQGGLGDVQRRCQAGDVAVVHDGDQVTSVAETCFLYPQA
jgi:hypothetical protein